MGFGNRSGYLVLAAIAIACGGSTSDDAKGSGGGSTGTGGLKTGGAGGTAGKGGSGGATGATGGTLTAGGAAGVGGGPAGGVAGVGGGSSGGAAGAGGATGGAAGMGGSGGTMGCAGLAYCACKVASGCTVFSEPCFCPCGIESCEPNCACACGGGAYLGCGSNIETYYQQMIGTWLIGWSGGLNHYSWVRIEPGGVARFLDGAGLSINSPYWNCNGLGSWTPVVKPDSIQLVFSSSCSLTPLVLSFTNFGAPGSYPKGAIKSATVTTNPPTQSLEAYDFKLSQCDAAMTSCTDPL